MPVDENDQFEQARREATFFGRRPSYRSLDAVAAPQQREAPVPAPISWQQASQPKETDKDTQLALVVDARSKEQDHLTELARRAQRIKDTETDRHVSTQLEDLARREQRITMDQYEKALKEKDTEKSDRLGQHYEDIRHAVMFPDQYLKEKSPEAARAPQGAEQLPATQTRQPGAAGWAYGPDGTPQWNPSAPRGGQPGPPKPPEEAQPEPEPVPSPDRPPPPQPALAPIEEAAPAPPTNEAPRYTTREELRAALYGREEHESARGEITDRKAEQQGRQTENTDAKQEFTDRATLRAALAAHAQVRQDKGLDRDNERER